MADEAPKPAQEVMENSTPQAEGVPSASEKAKKRNYWIIAGAALAAAGLCFIACVALAATGMGGMFAERAPVESVVDTFIKDMEAKDFNGAYALLSPRTQKHTTAADLQKMVQGNNYVLFEGYQSLRLEALNFNVGANTNPDLPQGTVANVQATASYDGGFSGNVVAVLEKVDGAWKLYSINITVPPDKFHP